MVRRLGRVGARRGMLTRWQRVVRKLKYARWHARQWYARHETNLKAHGLLLGCLLAGFLLGQCSSSDDVAEERENSRRHLVAMERSQTSREGVFRMEQRILREDLAAARARANTCSDVERRNAESDRVAEEVRVFGEAALAQRRGGRQAPTVSEAP